MTATATRMQTVHLQTGCTKTLKLMKKNARCENASRREIEDWDGEPIALGASLPTIAAIETESALSVSVLLNGVDVRSVNVLASATAITIEIRIKHTVPHSSIIQREVQHQCVTRELQMRSAIKEGSISVRVCANQLVITCSKEPLTAETTWSEFIQFDTRGSLGCV